MEGSKQSSSNSKQNQSMTDRQSPHNLKNNIKERKDISEVEQIQPNEIDPNCKPPTPPINKPIIQFDSLKPEQLPRTSDGLYFRVGKVIWPELPTKSTEESKHKPFRPKEIVYFSESAEMLQSTTLTKNFNHIMEMEGLTQSSSNSQQNQSMTDRQSPHNHK